METLKQLSDRLEVVLTGWTNGVMAREADKRGFLVKQGRSERSIIIESPSGRRLGFQNGRTRWNTLLARKVAKNKEATAALLAAASVKVPEGHVFQKGEATRAWEFARKWGLSVIKPVDSLQGRNVYAGLSDEATFRAAFNRVAENRGRVLVQEHISGVERRYLTVQGKVVAVSERRPASVLGDGVSTIQELVDSKNLIRPPVHAPVPLDEQALELLQSEGKHAGTVPAAGERVFLRRTLNTQQETTVGGASPLLEARPVDEGGDFIDRTDEASPEAILVAERAVKAVPGARLIGLDMIEPSESDRPPTVIEINTSPMLASHYFPAEGQSRDVAKDIIDAVFPSTVAAPSDSA